MLLLLYLQLMQYSNYQHVFFLDLNSDSDLNLIYNTLTVLSCLVYHVF